MKKWLSKKLGKRLEIEAVYGGGVNVYYRWRGHLYYHGLIFPPPRHPNCRCIIDPIFEEGEL